MFKSFIPLILLALIVACNSTKVTQTAPADEYFSVQVIQNDEVIEMKKGVIHLEKAPFKFLVTFYKTDNVSVSASWGKHYYDFPDDQNIFNGDDTEDQDEWRFVAIKTGSEYKFNSKRSLGIGDGSYQKNWFYDQSMDWHRFDKGVEVKDGVIYATRTVENISDYDLRDDGGDKSDYEYPIAKIDKDIYMVFAASHYEPSETTELQRKKFILRFK